MGEEFRHLLGPVPVWGGGLHPFPQATEKTVGGGPRLHTVEFPAK